MTPQKNFNALLKHTPGPWRKEERSSISATWEDGTEVQVCCLATTTFSGGSPEACAANNRLHEETKANGPLIAAAPEMYEALKTIDEADKFGTVARWQKALHLMRTAIKKAEGRQQ